MSDEVEPTGVVIPMNIPRVVGQEYMRARGITVQDITKNKIRILTPKEGAEVISWEEPPKGAEAAVVFDYYDPANGAKLKYSTVRFPGAKNFKLVAPTGRPPKLYFPPMLPWDKMPSNVEVQVHESNIKAIAAAKRGVWAVGLNGVWGWGSQGALIKDWEALDWAGKALRPCIVFDSNNNVDGHAFNPQVRRAAVKLSMLLRLKYGDTLNIYTRCIPEDPSRNAKGWGFDDWAATDPAAVSKWLAQPPHDFNIDPWTEAVAALNDEVVYIHDLKRVATLRAPHVLMTSGEFTGASYANWHYYGEDGTRKPAARAWLTAEERNEVNSLVYRPGEPKMQGREFLNLWSGMGVEPQAGDVKPWLDLLANLFPDERHRRELTRWMAWPLQNLGAKMHKAVLIVGESGVGKSFVAETLGAVYGENAKKVRNKDFQTNFNSNLAQTQLGIWEEATLVGRGKSETDSAMQNLKDFVTGHRLPVEFKGKDVIHVDNRCNLMILTNSWDRFPIQRGERRFFALEAKQVVDRRNDSLYWKALIEWRESGGVAALYDHLLRVPLEGFDPFTPALETEALNELRREAAPARNVWLEDMGVEGWGQDLMTATEIEAMFQAGGIGTDHEASLGGAKAMSIALKEAGVPLAAEGEKLRGKDGKVGRWYNVRRQQKYDSKAVCQSYIAKRGEVKLDNLKF